MNASQAHNILINKDEIREGVEALSGRIAEDIKGEPTILVALLKGSVVFLSDLMRGLCARGVSPEVDFMMPSSYKNSRVSSEEIEIQLDITSPVEGKTVLIVDDIIDTGVTLAAVKERIAAKKPARILTCALLDKPARRKIDIKADYTAFTIGDVFVVGYGLDLAGRHRCLPYIAEALE